MSDSRSVYEAAARLTSALADRYTLERELGMGGMATVYLAHDIKHDRKVAIKILKPELAAVLGAERFLQEIKTTAALQHPHILPLFDSGTAQLAEASHDSRPTTLLYYVMPFIDGETLRGKLDRETQLGIDESVRIATDVASALHYAHTHGVIHRDIKPENILLHDGRPMVADFGIALALSAAAGGRMTETGMSLGTPHYMSPEQATAEKDISARSDVYSLASVLFEMLAGQPPHIGGSAQQIIMKIIAEPVDLVTRYRKSVPPNVAAALAKALEKLPADRFQSAKAFGEALHSGGFSYTAHTIGIGAAVAAPAAALSRRKQALLVFGGVALLVLGAAGWGLMHPAPQAPAMQYDLTVGPEGLRLVSDVAISPDGSMLAFSAIQPGQSQSAIFLRRLDGEPDFRLLPGTDGGAQPDFSPDNQWIVFHRANQGIMKVSVSGGGASTILTSNTAYSPHWGSDDQIAYTGPPGTFIIPATGGDPRRLIGPRGRRVFLLPDGSGVLGVRGGDVVVQDLRTDSITVLVSGGGRPMYAESGHLLYVAEGGLFAVPFDLKAHRVTGTPMRVLDRVGSAVGRRGYSVSRNGTLVVHDAAGAGASGSTNSLVIQTFDGGADTLSLPAGFRALANFSPDGRSIAYVSREGSAPGGGDIFTYDLVNNNNVQITFEGIHNTPVWSPDSKQLLFFESGKTDSLPSVISVKAVDNSSEATRISMPIEVEAAFPADWPRDDLVFLSLFDQRQPSGDLYSITPTVGAKPEPYLAAPWAEGNPRLSPDGMFVVFEARKKDSWQIWMRDFPTPIGEWLVSSGSGRHPRWSSDGRFVYFWRTGPVLDTLVRAEVTRTPSVVIKAPAVMAKIAASGTANWDLHPDGTRFIVAVDHAVPVSGTSDTSTAPERHLILTNWFTTLRATAKPGKQ